MDKCNPSKPAIRQVGRSLLILLTILLGVMAAVSLASAGWNGDRGATSLSHAPAISLRYVATDGSDSGNNCANSGTPCAGIQHAVDVANPSDEIRMAAGVYTGVQSREGITQVVYISKTVTIRGGYTTTNWTASNPVANLTTLDALGQGRVLYAMGNISLTIEDLHITGGNGIVAGGEIYGGGVYAVTATVTLSACQVYSNTATLGGGVSLNYGAAALSNNTILSNTAAGGGGVYLYYGVATLNGNTISGNKGAYGGGVFSDRAVVALNSNVVVGNKATIDGGGMLYLVAPFSGTVTLSNNHILSNTANMNGGGVNGGPNVMVGNIIQGNTAGGDGGGVWGRPAMLIGNTVRGNHADGNGGGIFQLFSNGTVFENNRILDNTADSDGGGLLLTDTYSATLVSNIIRGNRAGWDGGGASLDGILTLTNNVVADNQADDLGSGLYFHYAAAELLHTTFARNTGGDGSGIHVTGQQSFLLYITVVLTNTILVSQTVGITATAGNTATLNGVLWFGNGANTGGAGGITVTNAITGNPAFAPDGYHLTASSSAIDQGVDAGVTTDIDGQARPHNAIPDLGADEFYTTYKVYLPLVMKNL